MAQKGTVIIPAYNRPEFLYLTLEYITKADGADKYDYVICLDHGFDKQCEDVLDDFPFNWVTIARSEHIYHKHTKLAYNILNGLVYAALNGGLVFLIEDDVFIGKDYFKWHEAIHEQEDIFCSIGAKNFNNRNVPKGKLHEYYIDDGVYQSVGVCYDAGMIEAYITPHFNKLYFADPYEYIKQMFPDSKIPKDRIEQAGLIHRISEKNNIKEAFPCVPRCFHAGIYGKNRGIPQKGTLSEKITFIRNTVFDINEMRKYVSNEFYLYDSEPVDLTKTNNRELCRVKNQ